MKKKTPLKIIIICLALLLIAAAGAAVLIKHLSSGKNGRDTRSAVLNCPGHTDGDNDGSCDLCDACVLAELDLFAVNDLHGRFSDSANQPGVDELTTYLENAGSNTVLLASGDMWQGSSESNLTEGEIIIEWMNSLGFVSMTVGNHEFDWGTELLEANSKLASFPFLGINVYSRRTGQRVSYCRPSVLVEREGVRIGIIGAIGDCYSSIAPDKVEDVYFVTGTQLTGLVKAESESLRERGADIVIYSIHDGFSGYAGGVVPVRDQEFSSYYDTALSKGYVDLVFEGHTHKRYVIEDFSGVYHLQAGAENTGLAHARIAFNLVNRSFVILKAEIVDNDEYRYFESSPLRDGLLDKYAGRIAKGNTFLGNADKDYSSDFLKSKIAELYFDKGQAEWGEEYDIVLGGGYISIRNPYQLSSGAVRYSDLQTLFPFDDRIVLCSIKGRDLTEQFINSRNSNYFVYFGGYGRSVRNSIDPDGTYYIVTDRYSSLYKPNRCTEIAEYTDGIYARDLLAEYFYSLLDRSDPPDDTKPLYELTPIGDIIKIGRNLGAGQQTSKTYFVKGTVVSVSDFKYGNITIRDENGSNLYVYGVSGVNGNTRYDQLADPPKAGDTVILSGPVKRYVSPENVETIELYQALLIGKE